MASVKIMDVLLTVHKVLLRLPGVVLAVIAFPPNQVLCLPFFIFPFVNNPFNLFVNGKETSVNISSGKKCRVNKEASKMIKTTMDKEHDLLFPMPKSSEN